MKITQIMLDAGFGGAERSFVDTSLGLAVRGHEILAICHPDFFKKNLLAGVPGVQLESVNPRGKYAIFSRLKLLFLLLRFRPEVMHAHMQRAASHGGWAASKLGIPVIAKLHNYVSLRRYRHCRMLVGTTEDQGRYLLNEGWPAERVTVIPNFSRIPPAEAAHVLAQKPLRLLAYGRYVHKKGFDVLLRAFHVLVDMRGDAELTIGGAGPEGAALAELAEQLGLKDRVRLNVWVDDVAAELDQADIFVLPSRDEPFGIVMLEAMARGCPIVTTRTQGPRQVLTDETAYFADVDSVESLANALLELANDRALAGKKAAAALELYRSTYQADAVLPRLEALYQSVCSR